MGSASYISENLENSKLNTEFIFLIKDSEVRSLELVLKYVTNLPGPFFFSVIMSLWFLTLRLQGGLPTCSLPCPTILMWYSKQKEGKREECGKARTSLHKREGKFLIETSSELCSLATSSCKQGCKV